MKKNKLAIIGGSGLYDIEEFKKEKKSRLKHLGARPQIKY